MVLKRYRQVITVLILLLSIQSVVLKADLHQFHQSLGDGHQAEHQLVQDDNHQHLSQVDNCQHCCHCHGGSHMYLPSAQSSIYTTLSIAVFPEMDSQLFQSVFMPALRPPIKHVRT